MTTSSDEAAADYATAQFEAFYAAIESTKDELKLSAFDTLSPLNVSIKAILEAKPMPVDQQQQSAESTPNNKGNGKGVDLDPTTVATFKSESNRFEALTVALHDLLREVDVERESVTDEQLAENPTARVAVERYDDIRGECLRAILLMKDSIRPRLHQAHDRVRAWERTNPTREGRSSSISQSPQGSSAGASASGGRRPAPRGVPPPRKGKTTGGNCESPSSSPSASGALLQRDRSKSRSPPPPRSATHETPPRESEDGSDEHQSLLQQQELVEDTHRPVRLVLSNGQILEGQTVTDEYLAEERAREMEKLAAETRMVRQMMSTIDEKVGEQGVAMETAEANADDAHSHATGARVELSKAARYKAVGATFTGALLGGLVAGPAGAIAGAKSATTIAGCVAGGMFVGGVTTSTVAKGTAKRNASVDMDYAMNQLDKK